MPGLDSLTRFVGAYCNWPDFKDTRRHRQFLLSFHRHLDGALDHLDACGRKLDTSATEARKVIYLLRHEWAWNLAIPHFNMLVPWMNGGDDVFRSTWPTLTVLVRALHARIAKLDVGVHGRTRELYALLLSQLLPIYFVKAANISPMVEMIEDLLPNFVLRACGPQRNCPVAKLEPGSWDLRYDSCRGFLPQDHSGGYLALIYNPEAGLPPQVYKAQCQAIDDLGRRTVLNDSQRRKELEAKLKVQGTELDKAAGSQFPTDFLVKLLKLVSELDVEDLARRITEHVLPLARSKGGFLWRAHSADHGTIYLLGTMHSAKLHELEPVGGDALVKSLVDTPFTHVAEEVKADLGEIQFPAAPKEHLKLVRTSLFGTGREQKLATGRLTQQVDNSTWLKHGMDDPAAALALKLHEPGLQQRPAYGGLETKNTRDIIQLASAHRRPNAKHEERFSEQDTDRVDKAIKEGNEKEFWRIVLSYLQKGRDVQDTEARNSQWILHVAGHEPSHVVLWVVGAGHIPGLLLRLLERGFTITPA